LPLETKNLMKSVEEALKGEKRGFDQTIEVIVTLKDLDLKKPANRLNEAVELPNPLGKPVPICLIASGDLAVKAKKAGADRVIEQNELDTLGKDKKALKKIVNDYEYFIAAAPMMAAVGKTMGSILGPRGKMPTPVPPNAPIESIIERHRRMVRVRVKDQLVIQTKVGTDAMAHEKIAENIQAVVARLEAKLEKGSKNIDALYIKTTMGKPVKMQI